MDERNIPIDINNNKLLEWLVSRRHVSKDWQNHVLKIREKINNAIQDMPAHEEIIKLLSGQHINYFHCLKIIEILKETEADTKNLFGRYGSQRMKDWQDIVYSYQKDNVYLAEAAQILIRNVSYEIPSLRKQIAKLEQTQVECEKKIKDYSKTEAIALKEFTQACEQLGIKGENIKLELLELLNELPEIYEIAAGKIKLLKSAVEFYKEFIHFASLGKANGDVLDPLQYLIINGNTTTFEHKFGRKPSQIVIDKPKIEPKPLKTDNTIDFGEGEIDFGENTGADIDFGDSNGEEIDFSILNAGNGAENAWSTTEEGFEIVDITADESGVIVDKLGGENVAAGVDALTILDNPEMRNKIIDCLLELESFLKMRLHEMSCDSDLLSISQMQDAPNILQIQTVESITDYSHSVNLCVQELTNKRILHLHNIKHSLKYIDILTGNLTQKLTVIEKMKGSKVLLEKKIVNAKEEINTAESVLKLLIDKTKQLQKDIQEDISLKYKGRVVNIVGGVNML